MSSQSAPKSTTHGTKVDLRANAPTRQEGAGPVASSSLAAESYNDGGAFASNRNAKPEDFSSTAELYESIPSHGSGVGTAPTYVNSQVTANQGKPHGKNIQEVGHLEASDSQDGKKKALRSEPGSVDDPTTNVSQAGKNVGSGNRGLNSGVASVNQFDELDCKVDV